MQAVSPAEQKELLTLMSHAQRGRMEEQRCVLTVSPQTSPKRKLAQSAAGSRLIYVFCVLPAVSLYTNTFDSKPKRKVLLLMRTEVMSNVNST